MTANDRRSDVQQMTQVAQITAALLRYLSVKYDAAVAERREVAPR